MGENFCPGQIHIDHDSLYGVLKYGDKLVFTMRLAF